MVRHLIAFLILFLLGLGHFAPVLQASEPRCADAELAQYLSLDSCSVGMDNDAELSSSTPLGAQVLFDFEAIEIEEDEDERFSSAKLLRGHHFLCILLQDYLADCFRLIQNAHSSQRDEIPFDSIPGSLNILLQVFRL